MTKVEPAPADIGCGNGQGVYIDSNAGQTSSPLTGGVSDVMMVKDKVTNDDKTGVICDDPGTTCMATHVTVAGFGPTTHLAQNGVQSWGAT